MGHLLWPWAGKARQSGVLGQPWLMVTRGKAVFYSLRKFYIYCK